MSRQMFLIASAISAIAQSEDPFISGDVISKSLRFQLETRLMLVQDDRMSNEFEAFVARDQRSFLLGVVKKMLANIVERMTLEAAQAHAFQARRCSLLSAGHISGLPLIDGVLEILVQATNLVRWHHSAANVARDYAMVSVLLVLLKRGCP